MLIPDDQALLREMLSMYWLPKRVSKLQGWLAAEKKLSGFAGKRLYCLILRCPAVCFRDDKKRNLQRVFKGRRGHG